jgi:hypothetical protein
VRSIRPLKRESALDAFLLNDAASYPPRAPAANSKAAGKVNQQIYERASGFSLQKRGVGA